MHFGCNQYHQQATVVTVITANIEEASFNVLIIFLFHINIETFPHMWKSEVIEHFFIRQHFLLTLYSGFTEHNYYEYVIFLVLYSAVECNYSIKIILLHYDLLSGDLIYFIYI